MIGLTERNKDDAAKPAPVPIWENELAPFIVQALNIKRTKNNGRLPHAVPHMGAAI